MKFTQEAVAKWMKEAREAEAERIDAHVSVLEESGAGAIIGLLSTAEEAQGQLPMAAKVFNPQDYVRAAMAVDALFMMALRVIDAYEKKHGPTDRAEAMRIRWDKAEAELAEEEAEASK